MTPHFNATSDDPDGAPSRLAVVVMAFGVRATLAAAVRSIQDQGEHAELVVVHSGPGDAGAALAAAGLHTRIIRSAERLLPGGTRNLGIASTRAPHVAFLADDCIAAPGWVAGRLAAHDAGERAVASALLCHAPANPVALAAHLSLYVRRMPRTDPAVALAYGASYARVLFDRHGVFRDDLESGEDTEFHQRLPDQDRPRWHPEIAAMHCGPEALGQFLRTQFGRGQRMARAWRALSSFSARAVAGNAVTRTLGTVRESLAVVEPAHRLALALALPLIVAGNVAYAGGALWQGGRA